MASLRSVPRIPFCLTWNKPGEGIIDLLVQRSSGQFIYAATVLKFVGADFCSPTKQLALILKRDSTAFSDLDQLYTQILSVYPKTVNIVQLLGIIMVFDATPEVIEDVLEMEEGEVKLILRGLSSLIGFRGDGNGEYLTKDVVQNVGRPYFLHASFGDYLVESSRSGPFHVNIQEYENRATMWSFALITKSISKSWRIPTTTRIPHSETWHYLKYELAKHFIYSPKAVKETIMTDIKDLINDFWTISSGGAVEVVFAPMRCLLNILEQSANQNGWVLTELQRLHTNFDEIRGVFDGYRKMLDQSLIFTIPKSREIGDLFRFLPGVVVQNPLTMRGMADLYKVKMDLLERLITSTTEPLTLSDVSPRNYCRLKGYISGFLRHRDRSQLYYCDPMLQHIYICRHFLSLLDGSHLSDLQSDSDLSEYVRSNLYHHLCSATTIFLSGQNIPVEHPAVQILNDLESTTYYFVSLDSRSWSRYYLARETFRAVLKWSDMLISHLKGLDVSLSNVDLVERVCQLTNKIYRGMLRIETYRKTTIVSLGGPSTDLRSFFQTLPQTAASGFSWELLGWASVEGRIHSSFTDFITTPEISERFYISPDIYHTKITEYSLETHYRGDNKYRRIACFSPFDIHYSDNYHFGVQKDYSFREHIFHAHPTKTIFDQLRSICSPGLIRPHYYYMRSAELVDSLEPIVKWLEELGSDRPNDLYDRFLGELQNALGEKEHLSASSTT